MIALSFFLALMSLLQRSKPAVDRGLQPRLVGGCALFPARDLVGVLEGEPDVVKAFEQTLRAKGNPSVEFVLYPGAPHAFFSDDRPQVYRKDAAEDAWKRCLAFFDKHLKA